MLSSLENIGASVASGIGLKVSHVSDDSTGRIPKTWVTGAPVSYDITTAAKFLPFGVSKLTDERVRSNAGENIDNPVLLLLQWIRYVELGLGHTKAHAKKHGQTDDWWKDLSGHTTKVWNAGSNVTSTLLTNGNFSQSFHQFSQEFREAAKTIEGFAILNKINTDTDFALRNPLDPSIPQLLLDHRKSLTVFSPVAKQLSHDILDLKKLTNNWMAIVAVSEIISDPRMYAQGTLDMWLTFYHSMKRHGFNPNTFEQSARFAERLLNPVFTTNQIFTAYASSLYLARKLPLAPQYSQALALAVLASPILKKSAEWAVDLMPNSPSKEQIQNDTFAQWLPYAAIGATSIYTFHHLQTLPLAQKWAKALGGFCKTGQQNALYAMFGIGFAGSMLSLQPALASGIEHTLTAATSSFVEREAHSYAPVMYYTSQALSLLTLTAGLYGHQKLLKAYPAEAPAGKTLQKTLSTLLAGHVALDYVVKFWPVISEAGSDIFAFIKFEAEKTTHGLADSIAKSQDKQYAEYENEDENDQPNDL